MRRLALLLALAAALAPAVRGQSKTDLSADSTIQIDDVTGDLVAKPNARLVDKNFLLTADEIRYNERTQIAIATGGQTRAGGSTPAKRTGPIRPGSGASTGAGTGTAVIDRPSSGGERPAPKPRKGKGKRKR